VRNSLVRFQSPTREPDTEGHVLVSLDGQAWQTVANWNATTAARGAANDGWQTVSLGQIPAGARVRELHVRFDHQSGRTLQLRKVVWSKR
jgi:hypothetical protein